MQELIYRVTQVSELQTMAAVQQLQLGKQYPDATGADGTWQTTVPGIASEISLHLLKFEEFHVQHNVF
jgi:hypothetical protein